VARRDTPTPTRPRPAGRGVLSHPAKENRFPAGGPLHGTPKPRPLTASPCPLSGPVVRSLCPHGAARANLLPCKVSAHRPGHRSRGYAPAGASTSVPQGAIFRGLGISLYWDVRFTARPRKRGRPAYFQPRSRWLRKDSSQGSALYGVGLARPLPPGSSPSFIVDNCSFFPTPHRLRSVTDGPARCAQKTKARARGGGAARRRRKPPSPV
jgi:hypothetical protein